ncbi:N-acetylneuraminate lyase [Yoonia sp.]|uniref:N-acetylneuraminate lyase n=1 Tax=Yoonia sp. TaxID=2212373 RepID=UPI002DFD8A6D|nr:N-acetylneuraminate lyase [Yoonia sp.]
MTPPLAGIYAALLTPFNTKGEIDPAATEALVAFQIQQGLAGVYVGGSSGEAMAQSIAERADYLRLVAGFAQGQIKLIAHVGAVATDDVLALAAVAADAGYDTISAITPYYYPFSRAEVMAHYSDIAERAALPLVIYNFPAITAGFTLAEMATLLDHPKIIGVKHTSTDMYMLEKIKRRCPNALIYNGYDEMCLAGLVTGADGAIGTTYNFMGDLFVEIERLVKAQQTESARSLQIMANAVIDVLVEVGVMPGSKGLLGIMGIPMGDARRPFRRLTTSDHDRLAAAVQPILDWRTARG